MIRLSTLVQDRAVIKLLLKGHSPKAIVMRCGLSSISVVYNAIRRNPYWKSKIKQKILENQTARP